MFACAWLPAANRSIRSGGRSFDGDGQQALTGHRPVFFHGEPHYTPVYNRAALVPGDCFSGPAIITEYSSATILPPGDRLRVDALDNLLIEVH